MSTFPDNEEDTSMDTLFQGEVNVQEAEDVTKRNMVPGGYYQTMTDEYPGTVTKKQIEEKKLNGDLTGTVRTVATIGIRGFVRTKNGDERQTLLRFDISPDVRKKKIYEVAENGRLWTGAYEETKDDLATKLWANAISVYKETHGYPPTKQGEILEFLTTGTYTLNTMPTERGPLVLSLHARTKRNRG